MGLFNKADSDAAVPDVTGDFIAQKMKKDGRFDAETTKSFVKELTERRQDLERQVFDTRYSERILREVHTHRDATKNAHKKATFGGMSILKGLDAFIIPQANKIVTMIEEEEPEEEIQGASEKLIRAYSPYEMPNPVVTAWNVNNQVWAVPLKMMTAWTAKKEDTKDTLESVNLDVEESDHVKEASEILGKEIRPGHRVTTEETELLKEGGFDLSRLNPGSTSFWSRPSREAIARWDAKSSLEYPKPDEKIVYQAPRYRSNASAKMTAYVWRDGAKHRFKIKLGEEVHSEIMVVRLRQRMGFLQDHMRHFPELKMYLGDKSFAQWERDIQVKYGTAQVRRHVLRRGKDEDTGEHWVVLRDIAIEARPVSQIRVSPIDYGSYDGSRFREVRASALIMAFFAHGDHGTKNSREVLVEDEDGDYHVEHRSHDVGATMGRAPIMLRDGRDILNFGLPLTRNKPEEYDRNYIWSTKKGDVKFIWNDFWHHVRDHSGATYADFQWAARLIASLTVEEITEAVRWAGIPDELVSAYLFHIMNMRNRAAKAFGMAHGEESIPGRGPIQLDEPEPLEELVREEDGYQIIKKGKIVGNYYKGSTILPLLQETWFTKINSWLSGRSIGRDIGSQYVEASFMPLVRLDTHVGRTLWEREVPWTMTTFSVGIGLNATVARIVKPNRLYNSAEGRSRAYVVHDTLSFSVGVGFPAVSSALARLGPELSISAELYRRRFEHIHYSETVYEGYRSPVIVHRITKLGNIEKLAVSSLTPGDVLREHTAVGAVAAGHIGFGLSAPYVGVGSVGSSLSMEGGQTNWQTVSYTKDPIGSMHILLENDYERTMGAGTEQFNLSAGPIVNAAAFALGAHRARINYDVWNIEIAPKAYDLEHAVDGLSRSGPRADELVSVLKTLRKQPHLVLPENEARRAFDENVKLRFRAKANKKEVRSNAQLLYLLNHDRKNDTTDFSIESDDYEYKFFTKARSKRGYAGIEKTILDLGTPNSVIREGTSKRLMVEMDRSNTRSFVVWIDVFDYYRSLKRKGVLSLLDRLNKRYSNPNEDGDFFPVPPMASEEPYKRVYANARIYVNGDKLLQLAQNTEPKKLLNRLKTMKQPISFRDKRKIKAAIHSMGKAIEVLNKLGDNAKGKMTDAAQDRLAMAALKLVNSLYQSNKWGVNLLHQLLGEDGMMIVGEVYGIHERSNMLQDPDWVSRLRFAGKSWGKLTNVAPVSRFVRVDQPTPANEHALLDIPFERFLGNIVTGYSGGWVGLGNR